MQQADPLSSLVRPFAPRDARLRGAVTIALLFYSGSLVVFVTSGFLRGNYDPRDIYQVGIPMMVVDGLIAFQLVFLLGWAERLAPILRWSIVTLGVVAVAALQSMWDTQLRIWAGTVWSDYGTVHKAFVRAATLNVYHSGMFVALLAFQAANQRLRENQRQLGLSRASERDAHMLALRFQLNPHFLFNTLNAISSLVVVGRAGEAEEMIDRLSSFLRRSLTADPRSLVSLEEEFEMLDSYLEIESVRFGDRLNASIDLPPHLSAARIPPFLLQPIVENAIKYAVAPSQRPVRVAIAAEEENGRLVLRVADDGGGCGDATPGTGVGLGNVRERLRLRYAAAARLDMDLAASGCTVEIRLPIDKEGAPGGPAAAPAFA